LTPCGQEGAPNRLEFQRKQAFEYIAIWLILHWLHLRDSGRSVAGLAYLPTPLQPLASFDDSGIRSFCRVIRNLLLRGAAVDGGDFDLGGSSLSGPQRFRNSLNFVVDNRYESVLLFSANQNESFQIVVTQLMPHFEMT
jgi:hypothetical protein